MQTNTPLPSQRHLLRWTVVALVAIAVIVAVVALAEYHSGVLNISVTNEADSSVTYVVQVDGHGVGSGPLAFNQTAQLSVSLSWWIDACQNHAVFATSNAHMVAPAPASVLLCAGTSESVSVSI